MSKVKSIFFAGLKFIVPLILTLIMLYWIFIGFENFFHGILLLFIDQSLYFSGLGWIFALVLTALIGLLVQIPMIRKAADRFKKQFLKLPGIKTLYEMSSDLTMFFTSKGVKQGKMVKFETPVGNLVGIMTQDKFQDLPEGIGNEEEVAVYVPMSYQIGGFTFIVPKDAVKVLDISVKKGVALTMTGYISGKKRKR